jgi:hypothetical protein
MQLGTIFSLFPSTDSPHILLCTQLRAPGFPRYKYATCTLFNRSLVDILFS